MAVIFSAYCVYPNSLCIIRCLHSENEIISVHPHELPDFRPPNSPDLKPTDYKMWGIIQQCIYQTKVRDMNVLKQRLIDVWLGVEHSIVDKMTMH